MKPDLEIVDVIDENDNVIGQMLKTEAHAGIKILHREIAVLIVDRNNNVLLQQRSFKKKFFPGVWTVSAVGHVPAGKTPEEAAHQELIEELGFDTNLEFVEKRKYESGDHVSYGFLFKGIFPIKAKITIATDEVEQASFFSKSKVLKLDKEGTLDRHSLVTLKKFYL